MIDRALFVRIEAKEGKEDEVEDFLRSALEDVMEEEGTIDWYAVKFGTRDFAIFDTFGSEKDRLAHLAGKGGPGTDRPHADAAQRPAQDRACGGSGV